MIKMSATIRKPVATGRPKIRNRFPLKIMSVCRKLASVVGPNTIPMMNGATGSSHFRRKNPITPAAIMTQTSKMEFRTL